MPMHEDNYKDQDHQEDIFSRRVRAGKRTYFFDVKATRNNDYYITITESKRSRFDDGSFTKPNSIYIRKTLISLPML